MNTARFFKRRKIGKHTTVNLSRAGASISFGRRGAQQTIGTRGYIASLGVPGTGVFLFAKTRPIMRGRVKYSNHDIQSER